MKKIIYLFLIFLGISLPSLAQNEGISFQGLARNAAGEVIVSQKISLRLSILLNSESGGVAYVETRQTTTNPQGIFSLVVGDSNSLTKSSDFSGINWGSAPKFIKVEMDSNGGTSFTAMGTSKLQPVPFAFYAYGVNAENVNGILPLGSGGTGVASIAELKTSLGVDKVNNTVDANKPVSTAMQGALDTKVDNVKGKELSTNDYSTLEKTKLAAITGTNTGDQINITGNAATATKLASARNINGVAFDGTADISIVAATSAELLTGTTIKSTVTGSSLTSVGTLTNLTVTNPIAGSISGNAATATLASTVTTNANLTGDVTSIGNAATIANNAVTTSTIADGAITNAKITDVAATKIIGTLPVANGGTGATTFTANNVLLGNGTSALQAVAPGTSGNVLTSNGTTWTSAAPSGGGSTTYSIGDSYGGGIVFYVTSDGQHGLISENQLISPNANSSSNSDIFNYSLAQNMISDPNNHSTNGKLYTDWRLPTKSEFERLYAQRALFNSNYQGRLAYYVWTSTPGIKPNETSKMTYYYQGNPAEADFNGGPAGVIAIRSF